MSQLRDQAAKPDIDASEKKMRNGGVKTAL